MAGATVVHPRGVNFPCNASATAARLPRFSADRRGSRSQRGCRSAPHPEPKRPGRWGVWIVLGIALLFGIVIGGAYWFSQRGQISGAVAASPTAKSAPTVAVPAAVPSAPQLAVGLPPLSGPTTTGSSPAPPPSQPPQLAVGLRPIMDQPPSDAPAPEPAAEAPPAAEPLPSPAPPPKPHRKASAHQSSPGENPSSSSGVIKF